MTEVGWGGLQLREGIQLNREEAEGRILGVQTLCAFLSFRSGNDIQGRVAPCLREETHASWSFLGAGGRVSGWKRAGNSEGLLLEGANAEGWRMNRGERS